MPYMIQTTPDPEKAHLREQLVKAHSGYLEQNQTIILAAGVLMEEDGKNVGGLLIIDVDERVAAERFVRDDPFAPLFASVVIKRWRKGFFNFKRAT